MEMVFEHLATELGVDPLELRMNNFLKDGDPLFIGGAFEGPNRLPEMIATLKQTSNYDARVAAINDFNKVCIKTWVRLQGEKLNSNY